MVKEGFLGRPLQGRVGNLAWAKKGDAERRVDCNGSGAGLSREVVLVAARGWTKERVKWGWELLWE